MLVQYLFGMSKKQRHLNPSQQRKCVVHHLQSGMSRYHQVGYIIFTSCSVCCNSMFGKCSTVCSGLVSILYRSLLCALFFKVHLEM